MRERLLAEHLGCTAQDVAHATERTGSLHAAIASLDRGGERTLPSVEPDFDATLDAVVPDRHLFDPERALDAETIVADLLPQDDARTDTRGRLIGIAAGVALLAAMALAWRVTPLDEWLAFDRLIDAGDALRDSPWAAAGVVLVYAAGGLVAFPLLVLIAATAMLFGPLLGPIYALLGALASATLTFAIGRKLGRETVRRLAGQRVNELSRRLARRGSCHRRLRADAAHSPVFGRQRRRRRIAYPMERFPARHDHRPLARHHDVDVLRRSRDRGNPRPGGGNLRAACCCGGDSGRAGVGAAAEVAAQGSDAADASAECPWQLKRRLLRTFTIAA